MKQEAIYNILFIDDDCDAYIPVLEPFAWKQGFTLYQAENVQNGLKLLSENPDSIDAVLLDITFSPGEIQGLEALKKIRHLYPFLPVVMLTGSDRATDLQKVVKCMRHGAYDYLGKQNLDPEQLFKVLYEAIQKFKHQYRLEIKIADNSNSLEFYYVMQEINTGLFHEQAVFGFQLVSVNKPKDDKEEELLKKSALQWHSNLLKSIQIAYKDNLVINLKFISEKGKLNCYITFSLLETDSIRMKNSLANLFQDLRSFFIARHSDTLHPYIFEEITNDKLLLHANTPSRELNYTLFYRKPLRVKESSGIGFTNTNIKNRTHSMSQGHGLLSPEPSPVQYDYELLKALANQKEVTEIDIQIVPRKLSVEETQAIKQVIQKPSLLAGSLNIEKGVAYILFLEQFINSGNDKFGVSILAKHTKPYLDQHLKTGIINYFFGGSIEVECSTRIYNKLFRYSTTAQETINQLPFTYNLTNILQAFHLPFPESNYLPGVLQQSNIFHRFPETFSAEGVLLGEKKIGKDLIPIRIGSEDLARHLYIMGQTGTGKSTILKTMIADCLKENLPFALIDPHGDSFAEIVDMISQSKRNKTVIIDITDPSNSAKHNPIGFDENFPQSKSLVINELLRIFGTLYDMKNAGGPMFELYLKNGLLLVMDEQVKIHNGVPTLQNFVDIFFKDHYRSSLLEVCGNKKVTDFFNVAEKNSGDWSFSNFATYVTSKLTRFTEDYYLTPIITAKENNINFRSLIDEGNILLVRLDKGLIGGDNVSLLGQMIISSIVMAAMSRANIDKKDRKQYYLFIDEFQNFIKGDISSALSEVRKYGLSMILANQTLGQLKDKENDVIEGLLGNVGSMLFFRPGINDYEKIRHYFEPDFEQRDVLKLPNFNCIGRILIDNVPGDPFVFQTIHKNNS